MFSVVFWFSDTDICFLVNIVERRTKRNLTDNFMSLLTKIELSLIFLIVLSSWAKDLNSASYEIILKNVAEHD